MTIKVENLNKQFNNILAVKNITFKLIQVQLLAF